MTHSALASTNRFIRHAALCALTFGLAAVAAPASAGNFAAKIDSILLYEGGNLVYVYPQGGVPNPPACHGSNGNYTSFSMARPRAKEYLAALLMAHAAGKTVAFYTYETCADQSVSATLAYFAVGN
jgi:hypothetical protein